MAHQLVPDATGPHAWVGTPTGLRSLDLGTGQWTAVNPMPGSAAVHLELSPGGDRLYHAMYAAAAGWTVRILDTNYGFVATTFQRLVASTVVVGGFGAQDAALPCPVSLP